MAEDSALEKKCAALFGRRNDVAREAASLLVGVAQAEFKRSDAQFRLVLQALRERTKPQDVKEILAELGRLVAALDHTVGKYRKTQQDLAAAESAFAHIDRRAVTGDDYADEVYVHTHGLIETARRAVGEGETERGAALVGRVKQDLDVLTRQVNRTKRDARLEVELWRKTAALCPGTLAPFANELAQMPTEPSDDALAAWISLKRRIANRVADRAAYARTDNANSLNATSLQYQWGDQNKQALKDFAAASYNLWRQAVCASPAASSSDKGKP